ncbi:MAG: sulfite exporter TauE/SafE family protein [Victivallaceae bacterium]|nr:sulfite exporter TauE/SafE family protein [Victivallaceae bacterium]
MDFFFAGFSHLQLGMLALAALLIGFNKTGVPGIGLLPVVLLTLCIPDTHLSTGLQLVMLCMADVMAVIWYRRSANWKIIVPLLPSAGIGLALGAVAVKFLDDAAMRLAIGWIVIVLCLLSVVKDYVLRDSQAIPKHWSIAAAAGILCGFTTMVANAAGPVMAIYFLSLRLEKREYVGTGAWFFLLMNWTKLPIFCLQGRVTAASIRTDLGLFPVIVLGAALGIWLLRYIPQKWFNRLVLLLSFLAALKLI